MVEASLTCTPLLQMLLVPIDTDVGHKDASYAGTAAGPEESSQLASSEDAARQEASRLSALKPSASLLAGGVGYIDDEEEEDAEGDEVGHSTRPRRSEEDHAEGEITSRPHVLQAEMKAAVQPVADQYARDDLLQKPGASVSEAGGDHAFETLRGEWEVTNVFRHGSVPGTLYLFEESLVFRSDPSASEGKDGAVSTWLVRQAGCTWRWRLDRLTQVTRGPLILSLVFACCGLVAR